MKIRTDELKGIQLDYAVTLIASPESLRFGIEDWRNVVRLTRCRWGCSWVESGPLIDAMEAVLCHAKSTDVWTAENVSKTGRLHAQQGPTLLVAALRLYVKIHWGDEVEIPEELL